MSLSQKFLTYIMAPLYLVGFGVETVKAMYYDKWDTYFDNTLVWAVLAAVALIALLWLAELIWFLFWRRKQYRMGYGHSASYQHFVDRK